MRRARVGLTFVELLIAATIFAILGVGLSTHLRAAVTIWRRTNDEAEQSQQVRITLRRLAQDLADATVISPQPKPDAPEAPLFDSGRLAFITVAPGRDGLPQSARVQHVVYEVVPQLSTIDASMEGPGLVRRIQSYAALRAGETSEPSARVQTSVILPGVPPDGFQLRCAYRSSAEPRGWAFIRKPWSLSDRLPRLVEVTIKQEPPTTGSQRIKPVRIVTTIAIPTGVIGE